MTLGDVSDDVFRSRLQTVIEGLRYWIPSVSDAARVEELESPGFWKLTVTPRTRGACPLELVLRADRRYDLVVAGELFEDQTAIAFEDFLPLVEAISTGRILQRRRLSATTGSLIDVVTLVTFADGRTWSGKRIVSAALATQPDDELQIDDRHFLPYRR